MCLSTEEASYLLGHLGVCFFVVVVVGGFFEDFYGPHTQKMTFFWLATDAAFCSTKMKNDSVV